MIARRVGLEFGGSRIRGADVGSACDAYPVAELVGTFYIEAQPIRAMSVQYRFLDIR